MHKVTRSVVGAACLMLLPTLAFAQATITGVVKDASGAVLPGVTIETSSPVLIEKTRTAVTDGTGQYRIVDLRPGTYDGDFTLPGFSTVKREGIELTGTFVATVNADLKVGGPRGDDHRDWRDADRRRAERSTADDVDQRAADHGADRAIVGGDRGAVPGDHDSGRHER